MTATAAFLSGLLDYAGLFPPAQLDLAPALESDERHRTAAHGWMLGAFVAPTTKLAEICAAVAGRAQPLPLCLIGRGGNAAQPFLAGLRMDLKELARALEAGAPVAPRAYEVRLPRDVFASSAPGAAVAALLRATSGILEGEGFRELPCFVEAPDAPAFAAHGAMLAGALAANTRENVPLGLKVRCGGETPDLVPSSSVFADVLHRVATDGLSFKATAGLHQPLRHHDPALGGERLGFLNVFGAAIAAAEGAPVSALEALLDARTLDAFRFDAHALRLEGPEHPVSVERIAALRSRFVGLGTCSIDEPVHALSALGFALTPP